MRFKKIWPFYFGNLCILGMTIFFLNNIISSQYFNESSVCILVLFQISSHSDPGIQKYGQIFEFLGHFSIVESLKVTLLYISFQFFNFILVSAHPAKTG